MEPTKKYMYISGKEKQYGIFSADSVTLIWGTLVDVEYRRTPPPLPALGEEIENARTANSVTKVTQAEFTVLMMNVGSSQPPLVYLLQL